MDINDINKLTDSGLNILLKKLESSGVTFEFEEITISNTISYMSLDRPEQTKRSLPGSKLSYYKVMATFAGITVVLHSYDYDDLRRSIAYFLCVKLPNAIEDMEK